MRGIPMTDDTLKVFITGGAGGIGRNLRRAFRGRYRLRLLYHNTIYPAEGDEEVVVADIADFHAMIEATRGVDAIVHLAIANAKPGWTSVQYERAMLTLNVEATYNLFEAARINGVKKFVFASTNHVMGGYELYRKGTFVTNDLPPWPDSVYGATKLFGEGLGRYYSDTFGISVICLRIGSAALPQDSPAFKNPRVWSTWISDRDMAQLVACALDVRDVPYGIFFGISNNTRRFWDIEDAKKILGYHPEDDAEDFARQFG
jgi:uronate dehydrogenase